MNNDKENPNRHPATEKLFASFGFLTGYPTNPHETPLSSQAPDGLALVYSANTSAEADLVRQILRDAGFEVGYVASATTGTFGTSGSAHVYVNVEQEKDALDFLNELRKKAQEEQE